MVRTKTGLPTTERSYSTLDVGAGRYVVMAHLKQHNARRRGQLLARVGKSGTGANAPHLHMYVQNRPYDHMSSEENRFTYPMVFRNAHITRGSAWPRSDGRELRRGDRIRAL